MSFDAIIQALHEGAESRRDMAVEAHERAVEFATRSEGHHDVARSLDLLADALATGRITKDQLRAIVAGVNAEDAAEPIDPFDAFTDAQLDGTNCASCGKTFAEGESKRLTTISPHGQMAVCAGLYCKAGV